MIAWKPKPDIGYRSPRRDAQYDQSEQLTALQFHMMPRWLRLAGFLLQNQWPKSFLPVPRGDGSIRPKEMNGGLGIE
jgi:hypothetical protein